MLALLSSGMKGAWRWKRRFEVSLSAGKNTATLGPAWTERSGNDRRALRPFAHRVSCPDSLSWSSYTTSRCMEVLFGIRLPKPEEPPLVLTEWSFFIDPHDTVFQLDARDPP